MARIAKPIVPPATSAGWVETREEYRKRKGAGFSLAGFHKAALDTGAVPMPRLAALLQ